MTEYTSAYLLLQIDCVKAKVMGAMIVSEDYLTITRTLKNTETLVQAMRARVPGHWEFEKAVAQLVKIIRACPDLMALEVVAELPSVSGESKPYAHITKDNDYDDGSGDE